MLTDNVICFAKDWDDDPTSNTHVMRLLARESKVLWLNSIAMRTPRLASARDLGRIGRKLRGAARGVTQVAPNLWVASPLILPFPHSALATVANRWTLRATLGILRRRLGMRSFQLWIFLPNAVEYAGTLGESLLVYYCVDDWLHAAGFDGPRLRAMERRLCARADVVFATSAALVETLRAWNPETRLASHGVDHAHFARALAPSTPVAPEVAALPRPVLGIVGLIDERVDLNLVDALAGAHPEWSIAAVGQTMVDTSRLAARRNVHFLGRQPYARLPALCKGFAVGLIPFVVNDYTRHVNPIKLREYLSAGLPVVSTNLPEVGRYGKLCAVAGSPGEFVDAVARAIRKDAPALRAQRSEAMREETWERKVEELSAHVQRVQARKGR